MVPGRQLGAEIRFSVSKEGASLLGQEKTGLQFPTEHNWRAFSHRHFTIIQRVWQENGLGTEKVLMVTGLVGATHPQADRDWETHLPSGAQQTGGFTGAETR